MITPFYYDQKAVQTEKVPNFYLPNKKLFNKSVRLELENRSCKCNFLNEEVIILAHFCEIVGPTHLIVYPSKPGISDEIVDMIVLKAMAVDYQACERGDETKESSTQTLILDCSIPFFVHYFTLWDIYARGYVRPCCIIVCCRDKIRARELFITKHLEIKKLLKPLLRKNIGNFNQELQSSKDMIDKIFSLNQKDESFQKLVFDNREFNVNKLKHLYGEYTNLISSINEQNRDFETPKRSMSCDILLDVNIVLSSERKELRSIYSIMQINESDMNTWITNLGKIFNSSTVPETFSPINIDNHKELNNLQMPNHFSKLKIDYFSTAYTVDKNYFNKISGDIFYIEKTSPLCLCRTILDNNNHTENYYDFGDLTELLFPNLLNIKVNQCHFVSNLCKVLGTPIVIKLIACLFNQIYLIIIVSSQQSYFSLMSLLMLFLPKTHNSNYFICKSDWPNLEQLKESPVIFLNKEAKNAEVPSQIQGLVAIYDFSINEFVTGPKYCKGHINTFFESFKHLEYNHMYLEPIVGILVLNFADMIYLWISLMGRRDRRWIYDEYLNKLGYTQEDIIISERLTLFVLQTLTKSKQAPVDQNNFLLSTSLFNFPFRKEGK